ncbi:acyl carrier protein [Mycobacterium sp. ST-F2]|uniref:acyl carrier protein n=1 Tax=Mycobacterium sp. ST-F2 TaxID=1490484 RepID=UPI002571170B|nr:acyl carrier protein [Mycobacterium sp. ST-F2]
MTSPMYVDHMVNVDDIVEIFRRVLDGKELNRYSDFFELGGDSLLAIRVLSAIAREIGPELTYGDFVENPSSAGLFGRITAVMA